MSVVISYNTGKNPISVLEAKKTAFYKKFVEGKNEKKVLSSKEIAKKIASDLSEVMKKQIEEAFEQNPV